MSVDVETPRLGVGKSALQVMTDRWVPPFVKSTYGSQTEPSKTFRSGNPFGADAVRRSMRDARATSQDKAVADTITEPNGRVSAPPCGR